jgi:hypothetical protein
MNAFCLITFRPHKIWCDFLNLFTKYHIFIIVDDNTFDLYEFKNKYKHIHFIQIDDEKCKLNGFVDTNFMIKKLISGWDKALYYFANVAYNFNFIWFIEDDVFFYNEDTIINIDRQYTDDDLLSNKYNENVTITNNWHWWRIKIEYPLPYYNGMMCAVRFSNKMLNCIKNYATKHNTLFFLEALFPTIAIKNNLKYNNPVEFINIHYRHHFQKENINKKYLYHPLKDLNNHILFR